ncbi:uncharacterized protein LOC127264700 [Andrographis paniculata]|uniref:uncharacterized protein LOC127264700 n=1 Tax=Andrographis paniculata TaxID=175694 RepID=UPI0021E8485D|nr:uncharacterized protein LOC127264700 [Andrographis paniculata]
MVRLCLFFLLLCLACFFLSSHNHHHRRRNHRRRRRDTSALHYVKTKLFTAIKPTFLHLIKHFFPSPNPKPSPPPPSSADRLNSPAILFSPLTPRKSPNPSPSPPPAAVHGLHPCTVCGEIFRSPALLDLHHSGSHAVSDLADGENIVRIIFNAGWPGPSPDPDMNRVRVRSPAIHRILKIHNHPKIAARFEDHRERVKARAAAQVKSAGDERRAADGNEVLRFHCTTAVCDLQEPSVCGHEHCSLCGIIRGGFSAKMDGIPTHGGSYAAHRTVPEEVEEDFKFMHVRRALLVCRVIAGRVGFEAGPANKEDPGFDSLLVNGEGEEDELVVFDHRAVLPCFVILYSTA